MYIEKTGDVGAPATAYPQRSTIRHLSTNRNSSGRARVYSRNFSNTVKQKYLRITAEEKEGRQLRFACCIPSPSWHYSAPKGNFPARKTYPCQEGRVEWVTSFPGMTHILKVIWPTDGPGTTGYPCAKEWIWTSALHATLELNLNERTKNIRILGESKAVNLHDLEFHWIPLHETKRWFKVYPVLN